MPHTALRTIKKTVISLAEFFEIAPRLVNVTSRMVISYGLHLGANQILLEGSEDHWVREIISGYRADATAITVIRLCALLDRDASKVSFQSVYRFLKSMSWE
jgi:hypothetical protein